MGKSTHTFAVLEISQAAFDEIARLLRDAGYDCFATDNERTVIDMHGIGLGVKKEATPIEGYDDNPFAVSSEAYMLGLYERLSLAQLAIREVKDLMDQMERTMVQTKVQGSKDSAVQS